MKSLTAHFVKSCRSVLSLRWDRPLAIIVVPISRLECLRLTVIVEPGVRVQPFSVVISRVR